MNSLSIFITGASVGWLLCLGVLWLCAMCLEARDPVPPPQDDFYGHDDA